MYKINNRDKKIKIKATYPFFIFQCYSHILFLICSIYLHMCIKFLFLFILFFLCIYTCIYLYDNFFLHLSYYAYKNKYLENRKCVQLDEAYNKNVLEI